MKVGQMKVPPSEVGVSTNLVLEVDTLNSRGFNGKWTEHQIGEGFTEIDTRALVAMITTSYQKIQ